jgi:tetratricopeptide (TPR) repeat protein
LKEGAGRLANLNASYELSIAVLSPGALRLLSVLAMLPGGVAGIDLAEVFGVLEEFAHELRGRALVFEEAKRLRMLVPLRECVATEHPPNEEDRLRAIDRYLTLAAAEGRNVGREGGAGAVSRLVPEVGNIEEMLLRSGSEGYGLVSQAVYGWADFMRFTGIGSTSVLETVAGRAMESGNPEDAARCIKSLGDIALLRSDLDGARARYEQAMPLYQKVGDMLREAFCIKGLGDIALRRSDLDGARARYEQAMPLYQKVGSLRGQANCIYRLGDVALRLSDHDGAHARYEQALKLYQKVRDLLGEANCIQSLGDIALILLDHDGARARYEYALPLYQKVWDLLGEANCNLGLGDIASKLQQPDDAKAHYQQSLTLYQRIQDPDSIGSAHRRLARLAADETRKEHVSAAREAWRSIKRDDLVAELDAEFGA